MWSEVLCPLLSGLPDLPGSPPVSVALTLLPFKGLPGGSYHVLNNDQAPWFATPGLRRLGPNYNFLSCFLHSLTHTLGSWLTETPVPSALCHLHAFTTVASLTSLCRKALGTENYRWAHGVLTSFWYHPCLYFLFQLGPFSQPQGKLSLLDCVQGFIYTICDTHDFLC